ncbi:MAG: hypothetical protein KDC80_22380 [Saprospiraceae bacterium]|nr:hypothetical protein [Saprospiraceae bacterium]
MQQSYFSHQVDLNIEIDLSTGFPLYTEQQKILELVMNYSPLPYSISEYGCSKKCSIIIKKLVDLGIPFYAVKRGMIMERNLSPEMIREKNFRKRSHALTIENILYHNVQLENPVQQKLLEEGGIRFDKRKGTMYTGSYRVSNHKTVQFVQARSHIFPIVSFWDNRHNRVRELVIDPTLDREEFFLISQLRNYLHSSEAFIFTAQLFGHFKLIEEYLTASQYKDYQLLDISQPPEELSQEDFAYVVRSMSHAEKGTIGDPSFWTYDNNLPPADAMVYHQQKELTGVGDTIEEWLLELKKARIKKYDERVVQLVSKINEFAQEKNLSHYIAGDARYAEIELKPLKKLVDIVSTSIALSELKDRLKMGNNLYEDMNQKRGLNLLHGLSFRLRERIETLARISKNDEGAIDAQALNERYIAACRETIKQMNDAGLSVFIDQVGNIHGLLIDRDICDQLCEDPKKIKSLTSRSICHGSHIDTVIDAGKYDGRLGVLSGIEVADIMTDLERFYNLDTVYPRVNHPLMVSVFVGEEMTFTGQGVSMPGSAAVAGHSEVEDIYLMQNQGGETYRERLEVLLKELAKCKKRGEIDFVNVLSKKDQLPPESCYDPTYFFTPHSYERHIEQGDFLHLKKVPIVLVYSIMGIHQEDFIFSGKKAEEAALQFNVRLRDLILEKDEYEQVRLTGGIFDSLTEPAEYKPEVLEIGMRWTLEGERDHAGATRNENRRDAGVAAGRLINFVKKLIEDYNSEHTSSILLSQGGVEFWPGLNRNVIPGSSSLTIGLHGIRDEQEAFYFQQQIRAYIAGKLSLPVSSGGEGIKSCSVQEVHYLNKSEKVKFAIDLRSANIDTNKAFLQDLEMILDDICHSCKVEVERKIEQRLNPYSLDKTGQVLQIERSYGGSHNPNETQLTRDVLRGLLLQLSISLDYVSLASVDHFNLFSFVDEKLPAVWKKKCPVFISGALHDTCNISKAAARLLDVAQPS